MPGRDLPHYSIHACSTGWSGFEFLLRGCWQGDLCLTNSSWYVWALVKARRGGWVQITLKQIHSRTHMKRVAGVAGSSVESLKRLKHSLTYVIRVCITFRRCFVVCLLEAGSRNMFVCISVPSSVASRLKVLQLAWHRGVLQSEWTWLTTMN